MDIESPAAAAATGADRAAALFLEEFGVAPVVVASAAARVNLIGEHTDYNGGEVLPIAIARRTYVALGPSFESRSRAVSATQRAHGTFDASAPERGEGWWDYVAGVVKEFLKLSIESPQLDVAVWSDVPTGAGLSSSAALEVAAAIALGTMLGADVPYEQLALLGQRAESQFVGVNSGIMDQFAAALSRERHALHVWCDTAATEHISMRDAVLIFDTAVPRSLRTSAFNTRRAECEQALALLRVHVPTLDYLAHADPALVREAGLPQVLEKRALHVSQETRRVQEAVNAMAASGGSPPGDLLVASHESLRDLYECSSRELDWFVERAMRAAGVRGARLTGAGWGGCAIAVGEEQALQALAPELQREYASAFNLEPRVWLTFAEAGGRVDRNVR